MSQGFAPLYIYEDAELDEMERAVTPLGVEPGEQAERNGSPSMEVVS